jgi:hypothetical protein
LCIALELKNKRVLVVGLGRSGMAAARFLRGCGTRVTVPDVRLMATLEKEIPEKEIPALLDAGVTVEAGGHGLLTVRRQDLIVVSPGVPQDTPELKQVRSSQLVELESIRGATVLLTKESSRAFSGCFGCDQIFAWNTRGFGRVYRHLFPEVAMCRMAAKWGSLSILLFALWVGCAARAQVISGESQLPMAVPPRMQQRPTIGEQLGQVVANDARTEKAREQEEKAHSEERQKRLVADTTTLAALAAQLKDEVEKSNRDVMSVDAIRKADAIEKLAHSVKQKMKGT